MAGSIVLSLVSAFVKDSYGGYVICNAVIQLLNAEKTVVQIITGTMVYTYFEIGKIIVEERTKQLVTHQDIEQMQMYVNYYNRFIKPDDKIKRLE